MREERVKTILSRCDKKKWRDKKDGEKVREKKVRKVWHNRGLKRGK